MCVALYRLSCCILLKTIIYFGIILQYFRGHSRNRGMAHPLSPQVNIFVTLKRHQFMFFQTFDVLFLTFVDIYIHVACFVHLSDCCARRCVFT